MSQIKSSDFLFFCMETIYVTTTKTMCIVCASDLKDIINRKKISCRGCTKLTFIPKELIHLKELDCFNCPNLIEIPKELTNLTQLFCSECPNLINIPKELIKLKSIS